MPRFNALACSGLSVALGGWSVFAAESEPRIVPSTWTAVEAVSGDLTFIRQLTGLLLTCPEHDLAKMPDRFKALPASRRDWAQVLFIEVWMDRAQPAALAYWRDHRIELPIELQSVFYRKLAIANLSQAEAELAREKSPDAANAYRLAVINGVAEQNPTAALSLARALPTDFGWVAVQIIGSLARSDREKALVEAGKLTDPDQRRAAVDAVLRVWFETRPDDALRWASSKLPTEDAGMIAASLIGELARKNFDEARRLAAGLNLPEVNEALESALAALPPGQLWARAAAGPGWTGIPEGALSGMIGYAAKQPPAEAIRLFRSIPPEQLGNESDAKDVATAWTLLDPVGVQSWAAALPDTPMRDEVFLRINSMLTEVDPKLALDQIKATPSGPLQARMVGNTAKAFGKKDIGAALGWIAGLPAGPNQNSALEGLAFIGADYNPEGMILGLAAMPAGAARSRAYAEFARRWTDRDPGAALAWFGALPAGPERTATRSKVFSAAAEFAGDQALQSMQSITDPQERAALVQALSTKLADEDPASALALIGALPDDPKRARLAISVLAKLAQTHPEDAARFALGGSTGQARLDMLRTVTNSWAGTNPASTAAWLNSLRQDQGLQAEMPELAAALSKRWANADADQAVAWAQSLPAGKEHDQALIAAASGMVQRFPQKAFDLIANDSRLSNNTSALHNVASRWFEFQADAAEKHIAESNLPEDVKAKLMARKNQH